MNKLDIIFSDWIDMMKNQSASLNDISDKIREKKISITPDDQFKENFSKFSSKDTKVMEFYLRHLEEYRRKKEGNRSGVKEELTIEHIIPKTLDDLSEWYGDTSVPDEIREDFQDNVVENIGNKILIYGDDNSSAGNNNYRIKQDIYRNGKQNQKQGTPMDTFQLVKDLLNNYPSKFNHEEVQSRAKELSNYAVDIW